MHMGLISLPTKVILTSCGSNGILRISSCILFLEDKQKIKLGMLISRGILMLFTLIYYTFGAFKACF